MTVDKELVLGDRLDVMVSNDPFPARYHVPDRGELSPQRLGQLAIAQDDNGQRPIVPHRLNERRPDAVRIPVEENVCRVRVHTAVCSPSSRTRLAEIPYAPSRPIEITSPGPKEAFSI